MSVPLAVCLFNVFKNAIQMNQSYNVTYVYDNDGNFLEGDKHK